MINSPLYSTEQQKPSKMTVSTVEQIREGFYYPTLDRQPEGYLPTTQLILFTQLFKKQTPPPFHRNLAETNTIFWVSFWTMQFIETSPA